MEARFFFLVFLGALFVASANCEISFALSQRLANNFTAFLMKSVNNISNQSLPPFSNSFDTDFVRVDLKLEPSFLESINIPLNQTSVNFSSTVSFKASGISLILSTEIDMKAGLFRKHQPYKIKMYNLALLGEISFKFIANTRNLTVDVLNVHFNADNSYVDFDGASIAIISKYLYGALRSSLNGYIDGTLAPQISYELTKAINEYLQTTNYIVAVPISSGNTLYLNYSLVSLPRAINGVLLSTFTGNFFTDNYKPSGKDLEKHPSPVRDYEHDFEMSITDESFNTLLGSLGSLGIFNVYIRSEDVPSVAGFSLNTGSLGLFIPGFSRKYGSNKKVDVDIKLDNRTTPWVHSDKDVLQGSMLAALAFVVRTDNANSTEVALNIRTNVTFSVELFVSEMKLKGKISSLNLGDFIVEQSTIGDVDVSGLHGLSKLAVSLAVPVINSKFSKDGIPIPEIPNVTLDSFTVNFVPNSVILSSNIYFETKKVEA